MTPTLRELRSHHQHILNGNAQTRKVEAKQIYMYMENTLINHLTWN